MLKPGPKRDDPLRQQALLNAGREAMEKKLFEEAKTLRKQGAKALDIVRAEWKGHRPEVGVILGEARDGTCWRLRLGSGKLVEYHKSHCTRIASSEAGKGVRKVRQGLIQGEDKVYGDGDI